MNLLNLLLDKVDEIRWKLEDFVWAVKDKIQLNKELKDIDSQWEVEEIEIKPKKKKFKKKNAKKNKRSN